MDVPEHCNVSEAHLQKKRTAITISKLVTITGNSGLFGLPVQERHKTASKVPSRGGTEGWVGRCWFSVVSSTSADASSCSCPASCLAQQMLRIDGSTVKSGKLLLA